VKKTGTKTLLAALTQRLGNQAMLTALIIISLISLLVATEVEPTRSPVEPATERPVQPKPKPCFTKRGDSDRLAA